MSDNEEVVEVKEAPKKPIFLKNVASEMITLISSDGFEFLVDKRCLMYSKTIKTLLSGMYKENEENKIVFDEIKSNILEKVIQYCYYKQRFDFDPENRKDFKIEPEISIQLMIASQYLEL